MNIFTLKTFRHNQHFPVNLRCENETEIIEEGTKKTLTQTEEKEEEEKDGGGSDYRWKLTIL